MFSVFFKKEKKKKKGFQAGIEAAGSEAQPEMELRGLGIAAAQPPVLGLKQKKKKIQQNHPSARIP